MLFVVGLREDSVAFKRISIDECFSGKFGAIGLKTILFVEDVLEIDSNSLVIDLKDI